MPSKMIAECRMRAEFLGKNQRGISTTKDIRETGHG